MRVLYCTDTYPPQVNGVSVVTALSVRGLAERGWECAVIAPRYPTNGAGIGAPVNGRGYGETELTTLPSIAIPIYREARACVPDYAAVSSAVRRFRPDLVHCETEFVVGRLGQIAAGRAGARLVSSYHTDFAKYIAAYGLPSLRDTVSAYLARFHRRSARTYTPSAPARDYLASIGVPHVEVWGRGVDIEAFHPSRRSTALRDALGLGTRFTFLYAGRLAAEKGVDRILRAYRVVQQMVPASTVHLVIAGAGPQEDAIRRAAPSGVTFLGYLDRATALPELYASCDAFVFASLTETLGLVVLEAMASGLPVVAAPAGGVADHLRAGWNGLPYPPHSEDAMAQAMVALARDPGLAEQLGAGARATAESLSWSAELDRLDASYRDVCERAA